MNIKWSLVIAGALIGFWKAADNDLKAWADADGVQEGGTTFDWKIAGRRWFYGLVSGAIGGLGVGQAVEGVSH